VLVNERGCFPLCHGLLPILLLLFLPHALTSFGDMKPGDVSECHVTGGPAASVSDPSGPRKAKAPVTCSGVGGRRVGVGRSLNGQRGAYAHARGERPTHPV
jgi:hypothetical protein